MRLSLALLLLTGCGHGKSHMQGAFWVFGHHRPLTATVPPVGPITEQIRAQDGFIDTEKPNWPWTMMLIPTMQPRFYRLLNNHHWRTAFGSGSWKPVEAPAWMGCKMDGQGGWTEEGWTRFGLRLTRHPDLLAPEALSDYEKALAIYRDLNSRAR